MLQVIFEALAENTGLKARKSMKISSHQCAFLFSWLQLPGLEGEFSSLCQAELQGPDAGAGWGSGIVQHLLFEVPAQGNDVYKAAAAAFCSNRSLVKLDLLLPQRLLAFLLRFNAFNSSFFLFCTDLHFATDISQACSSDEQNVDVQ